VSRKRPTGTNAPPSLSASGLIRYPSYIGWGGSTRNAWGLTAIVVRVVAPDGRAISQITDGGAVQNA
jgi:hypothetical protein